MSTIPTPEDTPEIQKVARGNNVLSKVLVTVSVLTLFAASALVWFRFSDSAKQSTTQRAVQLAVTNAARQDCKSDINSVYSGLNDKRDNLGWESLLANADGDYQKLAELKAQLEQTVRDIDELPTRAEAIAHGYTVNGVHHPPCPS